MDSLSLRITDHTRDFDQTIEIRATRVQRDQLTATVASYAGHFRHADATRLAARLGRRFPWMHAACGRSIHA